MKRIARAFAAALSAHLALWAIAALTAVAFETELRARGVVLLDPHALIEALMQGGRSSPPLRVLYAGAAAALFVTPILEMILARAAIGSGSAQSIVREAIRLTPASLALFAVLGSVLALYASAAALLPVAVHSLTGEVFDDLRRATYIALASLPALLGLLGFGVAMDVGRLHLAAGGGVLEAAARGLRSVAGRLFPLYVLALGLGLGASFAEAWVGRNDDASSLFAGGVVLLARPLSRSLFLVVAARVSLTRRALAQT